jgi:formylglycine-generating enzyme
MAPSDESMDHGPCCAASRAGSPQDDELSALGPCATEVTSDKSATPEMVRVEGGEFLMGTNDPIGFPADGEEPVRAVTLKPFWIDAYVVTNTRFAAFVEAPGYITSTSPSAQCCAMMCKRVQNISLR